MGPRPTPLGPHGDTSHVPFRGGEVEAPASMGLTRRWRRKIQDTLTRSKVRSGRYFGLSSEGGMHFSSRIQDPRLQNRLTRVHERLVSKGVTCVDLTVSNPTRVGFRYPEQLLDELAAVRGLRYDPERFAPYLTRWSITADGRSTSMGWGVSFRQRPARWWWSIPTTPPGRSYPAPRSTASFLCAVTTVRLSSSMRYSAPIP